MIEGAVIVGVDVAARRPCTAVALRVGQPVREADWMDTSSLFDLVEWIRAQTPLVVALDAPQGWNRRLLPHSRSRACDQELLRRRISVYQVPARVEVERGDASLPAWMATGFDLFRRLRRPSAGFESAMPDALPGAFGQPPAVMEVYPHAAFITLLGGVPAPKSSRRGLRRRILALREAGVRWDHYYDHDSLDALAAALTGRRYLQGLATPVGDPREGLIWLPVPEAELRERYLPLDDG
jgi:predicted nuclease with RNAse H fold